MLPAKENPCRKFQANIFNKTKCQNCFKPRESHLLSDEDLNQAKPVYGGWLCLAPEGTDFENPMQRSRKWQRRFFLLYEHGGLRYALDELTSTLPQGTINLNQCLEVGEAESRTGQRNSLCIVLPDREFFIRGENREDINGWYEVLTPYPRANKQNQKKKRKVEPPTQLEPGPAKVVVTAASLPSGEKPAETRAPYWQDDARGRTPRSPVPGSPHNDAPTPEHSSVNGSEVEGKPKNGYCFGDTGRGESLSGLSSPPPSSHGRFAEQRSRINETATSMEADMAERQGRSERRRQIDHEGITTYSTMACADVATAAAAASAAPLLRRAKSLDRRTTESLMTPDLLNFKKGWMVKLDADEQWKKHWFVLTDHSLRYYKDSIAEEALDLDGEINLSSCIDVSDVQAQRNYCFQIHTKEGAFTLSAMTAGIRRSWILAIMKNIGPSTNPDISSLVEEKIKPLSTPVSLSSSSISRPETTAEPPETATEVATCRSRARERRREGRSKTFDWAEFRPIKQAMASRGGPEPQRPSQGSRFEQCVTERGRRWEERQKWGVDGYEEDVEEERTKVDGDSRELEEKMEVGSPDDEIERQWRRVEQMMPRPERQVAIGSVGGTPSSPRAAGFVELLEKEIEALKLQLEQTQQELTSLQSQNSSLNQQLQDALQREQNTRTGYVSQATCERGFTAMEESHQRVVEDLQRTHQHELEKLRQEKDRLLAEETAATIAAIEAMKNAHREEMEREVDKARKAQGRGGGQNWEELHRHHEQELASVQREIEVLSEQYSQKCLENAHLSQALEAERKALCQCQRENQELNGQNQELNTRMAVELERLRGMGSTRNVERDAHGVYEREVLVRVKESEMQYLKQEMNSLKEELQTALRDKKYATDKYKDVYTELSIVRAKAERDVGRLMDQVQQLTESLGGAAQSAILRPGYDIMKSKSNPDILKMACTKRSDRAFRSKSVIDHPADFAS
uniref:myosin phosphatase Rho-interacting protein-like isoform X2 n=1 Tax=Myxine glutinosa TaxID=7769 RepID=UPI00358E33A6